MGKPPRGRQGPGCRLRVENRRENRHRNGSRCMHAALGTGTSGGGWRAAGTGGVQVGGFQVGGVQVGGVRVGGVQVGGFQVGGVQVGGASHRENRWVAGEN